MFVSVLLDMEPRIRKNTRFHKERSNIQYKHLLQSPTTYSASLGRYKERKLSVFGGWWSVIQRVSVKVGEISRSFFPLWCSWPCLLMVGLRVSCLFLLPRGRWVGGRRDRGKVGTLALCAVRASKWGYVGGMRTSVWGVRLRVNGERVRVHFHSLTIDGHRNTSHSRIGNSTH